MEAMKALTDLGKASITDCQKVIGGKIGQDYIYSVMEEKKALSLSFYINTLIINIQKMNDFFSTLPT